MFTGIIEEVGFTQKLNAKSLSVKARDVLAGTSPGDSISVNGACLTVINIAKDAFTVEIMPETRRLTNIGDLHVGDQVNLERALSAQGRFGGHFVQGHVDAVGKVASMAPEGEAVIMSVGAPQDILKYLVRKCFIAVNGVSLTVIECNDAQFSVSLVSYSRQKTNLGTLKQGNKVNLEVDIIAKYIEKFYHPGKQGGIISLLDQYDYLKAR
ncbi:MAG: riboflavin synthase [Dehalococcoidia bacterium]|nr:riboflavin synthase [Dehalococcoidia bacterium]